MKMKKTIIALLLALCVTSASYAQSQMFISYDFRANPGSEDAIAKLLTDYHDQVGSYKSGGMNVLRMDMKGEMETTHRVVILGEIDNFGPENPTPEARLQSELLGKKLEDHIEKETSSVAGYILYGRGDGVEGDSYGAGWLMNVTDPATFAPSFLKFANSDEINAILGDRTLMFGSFAAGGTSIPATHWVYAYFANIVDYMATMEQIYASDAFQLHQEEVAGIYTLTREFTEEQILSFE
ncbi:MAG: hypothetical protein O3B44_01760 [Bacteroidetes bacterium]|nr:hypothetical protein [Bacteroidota bacterium]